MSQLISSFKRYQLLLPALLFAGLVELNFNPNQYASAQDYKVPWCNTVAAVLRSYAQDAYQQPTYQDEYNVLLTGIKKALEVTNPKFHFYFRTTLELGNSLLGLYPNSPTQIQNQVLFLRNLIQDALSDLRYFDTHFRNCNDWQQRCNEGDHRNFVILLMQRGKKMGHLAIFENLEVQILKFYASAAVQLLESSLNARNYYCSIEVFKAASSLSSVFLLRDQVEIGLDKLINYQLRGHCR